MFHSLPPANPLSWRDIAAMPKSEFSQTILVPAVALYRLLRRVDRQRLRAYVVQRSLQRLITTARFRLRARETGVAPANFFETATSIALLLRRIRRVTGLRVPFPLRPEDVP